MWDFFYCVKLSREPQMFLMRIVRDAGSYAHVFCGITYRCVGAQSESVPRRNFEANGVKSEDLKIYPNYNI